ncbi:MAG: carbohydrate ABC transporter permease [Actinomycetota bacterium]|nr:carbohydrate ABC transporter permease [Actinomycetota bacterium]
MSAAVTPRRPRAARVGGSRFLADTSLLVPIAIAVVPILWLVYTSFRYSRYLISTNPAQSFFSLTFHNYASAFNGQNPLAHEFLNSLVIVVGTIVLAVGVGSLAGYSLSKLDWPKWVVTLALGGCLLIQLLPPVTLLPGFYVTLQHLGVLGSVFGLVLLNTIVNVPFATLLMKVYFDAIPSELTEAAAVDGASEATSLWRIMAPLAMPGIATTSILVGIFAWNEFLMGLTLSSSTANAPFTVGVAALLEPYSIQFGQMAAAASVAAIPMIAISVVAGRRVVQGLTAGALK